MYVDQCVELSTQWHRLITLHVLRFLCCCCTAHRARIKQQIADADRRLEHMQTAAAAATAQLAGATAELQAARTALTTATAEEQEAAALAEQPSGDVKALLERRAAARRTELKRLDKQLTAANEALGELADALHEATERQLSAQQALADADGATAGEPEPGCDTASSSSATAAAESEQEAAARRQALITACEAAVQQCEQQCSAAVQAVEQGDAERASGRIAVAALQKQQRELARQAASCTAAAREASAALAAAQSRAKQATATAAASATAATVGVNDDQQQQCDDTSDDSTSDARTRVEQLRAAMLDLEAAHTEAKKELKVLGRKAGTLGPGVDNTQVRLRVAHVETLKQQLTTVRSVSSTIPILSFSTYITSLHVRKHLC
jgi:chromosome segregation ATPase